MWQELEALQCSEVLLTYYNHTPDTSYKRTRTYKKKIEREC